MYNFRGTHKTFSYAWLLLVQVAYQQCFWKLTTALFISYQVSFDQQRGHINTLDSFGNAEINNHASIRASPVDAIEFVVKSMWTSSLSHTKKLCGKDKCQCQLSVQESNTKVTKPKHLTLRADQDAFADVHTSRNGDLFIGLIDHQIMTRWWKVVVNCHSCHCRL